MPMNLSLYPKNWKQIALSVKQAANWRCQECDRPCRRPKEDWPDFVGRLLTDEHMEWYIETSDEVSDDSGLTIYIERPQRFTLTTAHLNHDPKDCRPENLKALCSGCHLKYDAEEHGLAVIDSGETPITTEGLDRPIPIGSTVELLPGSSHADTLVKTADDEWLSQQTGRIHVVSDRKIKTFKVFQNLKIEEKHAELSKEVKS